MFKDSNYAASLFALKEFRTAITPRTKAIYAETIGRLRLPGWGNKHKIFGLVVDFDVI